MSKENSHPFASAAIPAGPSPRRIMELTTAYWDSMVLLTLNELKVCTQLSGKQATVEQLATELALNERALTLLLDAAVGLGLLQLEGGVYSNSAQAEAFLCEGKPSFLGGGLSYNLDMFPVWGQLPKAIRSGDPQLPAASYLGGDRERTRRFVYGMHHRALATAQGMSNNIDLTGRRHVLDLGGGSGAFSILLCGKYPGLRSTLLDLPGVVEVAAEIVAAAGMSARVTLKPGDFHGEDLGEGYDAALLLGILHREPADFCGDLIQRVFKVIEPGGMIVLGDIMLDAAGHGPLFPTLFGLNMLLTAPGGGVHASSNPCPLA